MRTVADEITDRLEDTRPHEWWPVLAGAKRLIRTDALPWGDAIGQPHGGHWTDGDYFSYAVVQAHIAMGRVAILKVNLGATPVADRNRGTNRAVLERPTKSPIRFEVDMTQHSSADGDGDCWWVEPVTFGRLTPDGPEGVTMDPRGRIPLEIGSTQAFRTMHHLHQYGAVARWPYESPHVWVLVAPEPLLEDADFL